MLLIHFDLIIKYYVIAGKTAFKLKLRPESTKVVAASVNLVVEKTESGLATNSIFFLFPFCEKSLICLEGKSMTPHRGNTIPFRSTQQLPRLRLGHSKGFLS